MLETLLSKDAGPVKQGLTTSPEGESSKGGEGGSFKDLFTKIITSAKTQEGSKGAELESTAKSETALNTQDKTLNSLLDSILEASPKSETALKNEPLQAKLAQAKSILESALQEKIDMKDLKDAKSLKALIAKANEKGLKIKNYSFEKISPEGALDKEPKGEKEQKSAAAKTSILDDIVKKTVKEKFVQTQTGERESAKQKEHSLSAALAPKEKKVQEEEKTKGKDLLSEILSGKKQSKEVKNNSALQAQVADAGKKDGGKGAVLDTPETLAKEAIAKESEKELLEKKQNISASDREQLHAKLNRAKNAEELGQNGTEKRGGEELKTPERSEVKVQTQETQQRISDAKSAVKHFANSLKQQVENYKPPISRFTLSMNPKNLGEVDVVIKSRGDTLSIQVSSATAPALQVLAQNSVDLRQNLINLGFDNVSMNFSSNKEQNGGQQQGSQQQQNRQVFEYEEMDEELAASVDSMEISLPKYV